MTDKLWDGAFAGLRVARRGTFERTFAFKPPRKNIDTGFVELPDATALLCPSRFCFTFHKGFTLIKIFGMWKSALEIKNKNKNFTPAGAPLGIL